MIRNLAQAFLLATLIFVGGCQTLIEANLEVPKFSGPLDDIQGDITPTLQPFPKTHAKVATNHRMHGADQQGKVFIYKVDGTTILSSTSFPNGDRLVKANYGDKEVQLRTDVIGKATGLLVDNKNIDLNSNKAAKYVDALRPVDTTPLKQGQKISRTFQYLGSAAPMTLTISGLVDYQGRRAILANYTVETPDQSPGITGSGYMLIDLVTGFPMRDEFRIYFWPNPGPAFVHQITRMGTAHWPK